MLNGDLRVGVIIPYRDRGGDHFRQANLIRVLAQWRAYDMLATVVGDDRDGKDQFNRSRAYNNGRKLWAEADVLVFAEADMLIEYGSIMHAIEAARKETGLVVPFTTYYALTPTASEDVRFYLLEPEDAAYEFMMGNGASIGAINVVSRETMDLIGQFDESFEGNWFDDDAMKIAFERLAGPTTWIHGPAWHLYHLPGHRGEHLSAADRAATEMNRRRLTKYRLASPERLHALLAGQ